MNRTYLPNAKKLSADFPSNDNSNSDLAWHCSNASKALGNVLRLYQQNPDVFGADDLCDLVHILNAPVEFATELLYQRSMSAEKQEEKAGA